MPSTAETSASTEAPTDFNSALNPPKRKSRKGLWAGVAAVIIVLGGGSAFASVAHVFSSGKTILLDSLAMSTNNLSTNSAEEHVQINIKNLNIPNSDPVSNALISTLNGSTIDLNLVLNPSAKQAEVDFQTQFQSVKRQGNLWVTSNSAILSASDFQSLLSIVPGLGQMKLPKYLVTDAQQSQAITDFWSQLNQNGGKLNKDQQAAIQKLETYIIEAIPDQYIHRDGLTSVDIEFDQAGLEDILKSEVKSFYDHKEDYANAVAQIEKNSSSDQSVADLQKTFLDNLNQTPQEVVQAGIDTFFKSGMISTEPVKIVFSKTLFGSQIHQKYSGGVTIKDPTTGGSGTIEFNIDAYAPAKTQVQVPSVNSSNSQTFSNWEQQLAGGN